MFYWRFGVVWTASYGFLKFHSRVKVRKCISSSARREHVKFESFTHSTNRRNVAKNRTDLKIWLESLVIIITKYCPLLPLTVGFHAVEIAVLLRYNGRQSSSLQRCMEYSEFGLNHMRNITGNHFAWLIFAFQILHISYTFEALTGLVIRIYCKLRV